LRTHEQYSFLGFRAYRGESAFRNGTCAEPENNFATIDRTGQELASLWDNAVGDWPLLDGNLATENCAENIDKDNSNIDSSLQRLGQATVHAQRLAAVQPLAVQKKRHKKMRHKETDSKKIEISLSSCSSG